MATTITVTKRTGYLTCGVCKGRVARGKTVLGFFCNTVGCFNSEAEYLKD